MVCRIPPRSLGRNRIDLGVDTNTSITILSVHKLFISETARETRNKDARGIKSRG